MANTCKYRFVMTVTNGHLLFRRSEVIVAGYNAPASAAAKSAVVQGSRSSTASSTSINIASRCLPGTRCCSANASLLLAVVAVLNLSVFTDYSSCVVRCHGNTCMSRDVYVNIGGGEMRYYRTNGRYCGHLISTEI